MTLKGMSDGTTTRRKKEEERMKTSTLTKEIKGRKRNWFDGISAG